MPQTLLTPQSLPTQSCEELPLNETLLVSELFVDTLQGEGAHIGAPASFLRLKGCTLRCSWCDTLAIWQQGARYANEEILDLLESSGAVANMQRGQHFVITGGSPLLQQHSVVHLLNQFNHRFGFLPFIEMENEAVLMPCEELIQLVNCFNNSPKLSGSCEPIMRRYKPEVIYQMALLHSSRESWFKFVINNQSDWEEIERDYLPLIPRTQIILMPQGISRAELDQSRLRVAEIAMQQCVRFADREHIILYDKKAGV